MTTCTVCASPTDAFLCWPCTDCRRPTPDRCGHCLVDIVAEMPAALNDIRITATRQAKVGNGIRRLGPEALAELEEAADEQRAIPARLRSIHDRSGLISTPNPVAWDAAALHAEGLHAVLTWAKHIAETRGVDLPSAEPVRKVTEHRMAADDTGTLIESCTWTWIRQPVSIAALCTWLTGNVESIRLDEAAGEMLTRLTSLAAWIARAIDRRDPDIYAGPCDAVDIRVHAEADTLVPEAATCGADLYARTGDSRVTCGTCGATYDVTERKEWLLAQIPDVIAPTAAIANALTSLQEKVTPSMIRQMKHAGEIVSRGEDGDRSSLYRVGDVMDVLAARAERKRRRSLAS